MTENNPGPPPAASVKEAKQRARIEAVEAKARKKAARPFWRKKRFLVPTTLLVLIVLTVIGAAGNRTKHPPTDDVVVHGCEVDPFVRFADAKVKVTNHSSKPSDYLIVVQVETADGQLWDTARMTVTALAPGQSTEDKATSLRTQAPDDVTCRLQSVKRIETLGL